MIAAPFGSKRWMQPIHAGIKGTDQPSLTRNAGLPEARDIEQLKFRTRRGYD
jgi:hypothetical protein